jgi:hypothetical protein
MTNSAKVQANPLTRRTILLRGAACAAGATALIGPATPVYAGKMAQTVAAYQDTPKDSHDCSGCILFQAPSSCQVVDGTIRPSGWCKFWAKKPG